MITSENFIDGKAKARKDGKCGYIDQQGYVLTSIEYDSLGHFIEGRARAKKNGYLGYIDCNDNGLFIFAKSKSFKGKYGDTITEVFYGKKTRKETQY